MNKKTPRPQSPRLHPLAAALAGTLLAASLPLQAQQQAPAAPAKADDNKLETVVVTANKRKENVQNVPASITVLDEAQLTRANVRDLDDLPALSPALTITYSTQPGNYSVNMRGIGTFSLGIGVESDVAFVIDDIPMGMQASAFKDLADVQRVEVLKGPQSTLFGKSAIAGAVNITTKPIAGALGGNASLLLTNDNESRVAASISGELSDKFAMRLALSHTNFDGLVDNLTTGGKLNGSKGDTVLAKLVWSPQENLDITLSPHYNNSVKNCCVSPFTSMTAGGAYGAYAALPASRLLGGINFNASNVAVRNDFPAGGRFFDYGTGLKIDYQPAPDSFLAGHTLSAISSYDRYRMHDYQDGDATDADILSTIAASSGLKGGLYQYGTFEVESTTQEFRLTSPDKGRLRYVLGLWYGKNDLYRALTRMPTTSYTTDYEATAYNTNYAIYGQSTFDLTPSTSLITGLRLNREDTGYTFTKYANPPLAKTQTGYWSEDNSEDAVTGRLGLEHRVNPDLMFYGTASTGHKGVAYDLTSSFDANVAKNQPVPHETALSFELGLKASLLDNRAMLSVALFRTNFKGFQQSSSVRDDDGVFRTQLHSIGELQTQGLEFEGSVRPTKNLRMNGSLAYTEATIVEFPNGPCYTVLNAAGTGTTVGANCGPNATYGTGNFQNLAGKTLPNAPKVKANLGGQYDMPLANHSFDLFYTGNYRWQSATQFSLNQDPGTIQPAYGIFDAGIGMKDKKGAYKLSFFVKNLLDKRYAAGLVNTPRNSTWSTSTVNVSTTQWTPPRDYTRYFGARLDLDF